MTRGDGFGDRLRALREAAGLTQEELATRAGLSAKAVSLLERGERTRPYPHTVTSLAEALDLSEEQRTALRTAARGAAATDTSSMTWPVPPTPLVGRDRELHVLTELLGDPDTRLVTLTGTGGVGKTRLALGLLSQPAPAFPAGAVFVPLAPIASPDLVLPTLVRALGLREVGGGQLEALRQHLAGRRMLLVLDNVEHLLDAAADLATLLTLPDGPVLLVTSRAPLRLRGEREVPVLPLWSPETDRPSAEAVLGSPAGRVFAERARAVSPTFDVTEANAADVAAICRRLSGVPLALEIAAARIRFLGPGQLLARLDDALQQEGARDLPERHRTLGRTLDWSHDLLDEADRVLLARLSVLAGDFDLDAAEAVGGDLGDRDVTTALGHLVDHSLVVAEADTGGTTVRYRMLEPVRQYAARRLADHPDPDAARLAHATYFLAMAEQAHPLLEGAEQVTVLDRLTSVNDDLRAAIGWTVGAGRASWAVRFGWALRIYWLMRDRREEGRLLLEPGLAAPELSVRDRAMLLHVLAFCRYGFAGPHRRLAEESLALFRDVGDARGEEYALGMLGFALLAEGSTEEARTVLEQALALSRARGDDANSAHLLNHLAVVPLRQGDPVSAEALARQALDLTRRTGERLGRQTALQVLGTLAWAAGDGDRARGHFRDSLEVAVELADTVNIAYCLRGLAVADGVAGASIAAARLLGAADVVLDDAGHPVFAWVVGELDDAAASAVRDAASHAPWLVAYEEGRSADLLDLVSQLLDD